MCSTESHIEIKDSDKQIDKLIIPITRHLTVCRQEVLCFSFFLNKWRDQLTYFLHYLLLSVCLSVCTYVRTYVRLYVYMRVYVYTHTRTHTHTDVHFSMHKIYYLAIYNNVFDPNN